MSEGSRTWNEVSRLSVTERVTCVVRSVSVEVLDIFAAITEGDLGLSGGGTYWYVDGRFNISSFCCRADYVLCFRSFSHHNIYLLIAILASDSPLLGQRTVSGEGGSLAEQAQVGRYLVEVPREHVTAQHQRDHEETARFGSGTRWILAYHRLCMGGRVKNVNGFSFFFS